MDKEVTHGLMETSTLAIGKKAKDMGKVLTHGSMGTNTLGNGKNTKCMAATP